jgi:hypothetical protein
MSAIETPQIQAITTAAPRLTGRSFGRTSQVAMLGHNRWRDEPDDEEMPNGTKTTSSN